MKFSNWFQENSDWNWKPKDWEPSQPDKWEFIKSGNEWKDVFYKKMRKLMDQLSKDEINSIMYDFNQIIAKLEDKKDETFTKDEVINLAKNVAEESDILNQLFDMI